MDLYYTGIIIALMSLLIIGVFHPIVIKTEYYTGTKYSWIFVVTGILSLIAALLTECTTLSAIFGVFGASAIWAVKELREQRERVKKGWFPMNPKRKDEYSD
ncbi:MAG: DUF4491 family protein [Prevotella sp.]